ncbi:MAG: hypothetical protein AAGE89_03100 [Pseudomonadota bacterium]
MENLRLQLSGIDDPDLLQDDTIRLTEELSEAVDPAARRVQEQARPGERAGGAYLFGEIALALATSGAIAALLDVLKGYFGRRREAEIKVRRADGAELAIRANQLSQEEYDATLARADAFIHG